MPGTSTEGIGRGELIVAGCSGVRTVSEALVEALTKCCSDAEGEFEFETVGE